MSTPPIQYSGPAISPEVPWETRRHLQLIYQKLGNHTQAFSLQQQQIADLKGGTTTIIEGVSGGGGGSSTTSGIAVNNQSGVTSYTTMLGDNGALIIFSDASPVAVSLTSQTTPWGCFVTNLGAGLVTLTPGSGTVNGGATFTLPQNYTAIIAFDATNWWASEFPTVPDDTPAVTHEWLASYDSTTGAFTQTQPAFTDISGIATPAQLPLATSTTFGIVEPDNVTITIAAGVITAAGGGSPNFADNETPSGTINGTNVTFTLAHTPSPTGSLILTLAGLTQWQNASGDYTLSTNTITFALAPTLGPLIAWYRF